MLRKICLKVGFIVYAITVRWPGDCVPKECAEHKHNQVRECQFKEEKHVSVAIAAPSEEVTRHHRMGFRDKEPCFSLQLLDRDHSLSHASLVLVVHHCCGSKGSVISLIRYAQTRLILARDVA